MVCDSHPTKPQLAGWRPAHASPPAAPGPVRRGLAQLHGAVPRLDWYVQGRGDLHHGHDREAGEPAPVGTRPGWPDSGQTPGRQAGQAAGVQRQGQPDYTVEAKAAELGKGGRDERDKTGCPSTFGCSIHDVGLPRSPPHIR